MTLEQFVKENITAFNAKPRGFKNSLFNEMQIKDYLKKRFREKCESVDVRSSRYDAIVDYNGTLLRIQIKGITGGLISFKDRDRGGQGIDYKHQSNQGKRITSKDCDIYAAVDKQVGICYLIPMSFADSLNDKECEKVRLEQISLYKENWDIIKLFATKKLP
ncbi:hypothetical protein CT045_06725 [Campylobacter upsaliensis]|nr:hypothetical protein [Campylobacter upsaliensis]EAJ1422695.1 hypothetical protein [Campylobacter upsaliensis]